MRRKTVQSHRWLSSPSYMGPSFRAGVEVGAGLVWNPLEKPSVIPVDNEIGTNSGSPLVFLSCIESSIVLLVLDDPSSGPLSIFLADQIPLLIFEDLPSWGGSTNSLRPFKTCLRIELPPRFLHSFLRTESLLPSQSLFGVQLPRGGWICILQNIVTVWNLTAVAFR